MLAVQATAKDTVTIAVPHFPPYAQVTDGQCKGFYCEIIEELLEKRLGLTVIPINHPWPRLQREVELGQIDIMFAIPTEARQAYSIASEQPVFSAAMKVFTYKDHEQLDAIRAIETVDDIKAAGFRSITNYGNAWHQHFVEDQGVTTVHAISEEHILRMLAARRGDIVVDVARSIRYLMSKLDVENEIIETDVVMDVAEIHLMVSRKSPFTEQLPELNKAIESYRLK
jgi:polar amino acid transport system substrate-binding protein